MINEIVGRNGMINEIVGRNVMINEIVGRNVMINNEFVGRNVMINEIVGRNVMIVLVEMFKMNCCYSINELKFFHLFMLGSVKFPSKNSFCKNQTKKFVSVLCMFLCQFWFVYILCYHFV